MRIIVSDSNCLIDLRKASLLDAFLRLPYKVLIPNTLFEEELLKFTEAEKTLLLDGLDVVDLPGPSVLRAREVVLQFTDLTMHDGFAFALAERNPGCILLTGDGSLRTLGETHGMEVHGVLWIIDQIHGNALSTVEKLFEALRMFTDDPTVRLPPRTLAAYIRRYEKLG